MDENLESLFDDVFNSQEPQEPQEPEVDRGEGAQQDEAQPEGAGEESQAEGKAAQDAETNARQAADRRRREQREREREARAYRAGWQAASDIVAELGGIEDADGNALADMDALQRLAEERRKARRDSGQLTARDIERIIDERVRAAQPPAQPSEAEQTEVQQQLAQIRQMDPAMTGLDDILQSEAGERFRGYVARGLDFVDAYTLAARERLAGIRENRAAARGAGKEHLTPTNQRGAGALDVPADEMALYRELNPEMSDKDIREHYNKYKKQTG